MKRIFSLVPVLAAAVLSFSVPSTSHAAAGMVCTSVQRSSPTTLGFPVSATMTFSCPGSTKAYTIQQLYGLGWRVKQILGPIYITSDSIGYQILIDNV